MNIETKEIFESIENSIIKYKKSLATYSKEDFTHKESPEIWSLAQMFEHLEQTSNDFIKAVNMILENRGGQFGGERNEIADNIFKHNSFPPIKVKVPEGVREDLEAKDSSSYFPVLDRILKDAKKLQNPLKADKGEYKIKHPVLGYLNAKEWYSNLDMHLRHHLRQKTELEQLAKTTQL